MDDLELWNKLYDCISDIGFGAKPRKDQDLVEFGFDDLDGVEFIMNVEEEFEVTINDEEAIKLRTLTDFYNWLRQHNI